MALDTQLLAADRQLRALTHRGLTEESMKTTNNSTRCRCCGRLIARKSGKRVICGRICANFIGRKLRRNAA
jgi:hypothetical protein